MDAIDHWVSKSSGGRAHVNPEKIPWTAYEGEEKNDTVQRKKRDDDGNDDDDSFESEKSEDSEDGEEAVQTKR